jgi:hypothetical protein
MNKTDAARSFLDSLRLHQPLELLDAEGTFDDWLHDYDNGVLGAAAPILARQESDRIIRHFEALTEGVESPSLAFAERESNLGLLIAMLLVGREAADGGVEITAGSVVFGDHPDGLSEIRIEVGALRGDFDLEVAVRWDEHGPNPAYYEDDSQPVGLRKSYELALLREQYGSGEPSLSDHKTRRIGVESLGMMVETYKDREAAHDPIGVAMRAYKRIERCVSDDFNV